MSWCAFDKTKVRYGKLPFSKQIIRDRHAGATIQLCPYEQLNAPMSRSRKLPFLNHALLMTAMLAQ
jgi:hypothetical protein